jgi:hypothetical protein
MFNNDFSSFLSIFIIGTIGTASAIIYYNIDQNNYQNILNIDINKTFSHKNIQTDLDRVIKTVENKEIQCELDIIELEDRGELEIIQTSKSNYRWFILKLIGFD